MNDYFKIFSIKMWIFSHQRLTEHEFQRIDGMNSSNNKYNNDDVGYLKLVATCGININIT